MCGFAVKASVCGLCLMQNPNFDAIIGRELIAAAGIVFVGDCYDFRQDGGEPNGEHEMLISGWVCCRRGVVLAYNGYFEVI